MNKTEILVTGKSTDQLQNLETLLHSDTDWIVSKAGTDEEAIEKFHQCNFDMVLLLDDISKEENLKLRRVFTLQNPEIIILETNGMDNSLLMTEIAALFEKQREGKKPSFTFVDDALKNAGLNIVIQ